MNIYIAKLSIVFVAIIISMLGFSVWCIKRAIKKDNEKISDRIKEQNKKMLEEEMNKYTKEISDIKIVMTGVFIVIWMLIVFFYE